MLRCFFRFFSPICIWLYFQTIYIFLTFHRSIRTEPVYSPLESFNRASHQPHTQWDHFHYWVKLHLCTVGVVLFGGPFRQVVWELCHTVLSHTLLTAFTILLCQYRADLLGDGAEYMIHLEESLFMHWLSLGFCGFCLCHRDMECLCVCVRVFEGQQRLMTGWRNKAQWWE